MDMYSASLVPVVAAPSVVPRLASLGAWDVTWSLMGKSHLQLAVTDDYGALVAVPYIEQQPVEH